MPLEAGKRFGPYEILAPIGAGGMGEVYKARDTRLDRTVAVKVLPSHIEQCEDFRQRFEREARAVSSLNHPHICVLFDIGEHDGVGYMVMEHLEGETLLERLKRGPLPLPQALKYSVEITDAMDHAHRSGIVHRDLKPGNIMLTRDGAKVLDFGLAKSSVKAAAADAATLTAPITSEGTVLGTPQYMSPEQLEGREADARTDIFAFGCVLYEMVTGKRAFEGKTRASVIAAILERDPPSVTGTAPPALDRTLRRCLAKDAEDRWQSTRDLRDELAWIAEGAGSTNSAVTSSRQRTREWIAWVLLALTVAAAVTLAWLSPRSSPAVSPMRFAIYPPAGTVFAGPTNTTIGVPQFALSADGTAIVFAAAPSAAPQKLWIRQLEHLDARPLEGTENANYPFWSPDGRWIGFFADGKLKKVSVDGGTVQTVTAATEPFGGSWGADDTILFSNGSAIQRVPAVGGAVTPVTKLNNARKDHQHRLPHLLPGGRNFLFLIRGAGSRGIFAGSLDGSDRQLLDKDAGAVYAIPGYLLYAEGSLFGQAFDADTLTVTGGPVVIAEHVGRALNGLSAVSASGSGILAHADGLGRRGRLTWFDRSGKALGTVGPEADYVDARISPDDQRIAASLVSSRQGDLDIWLIDLQRGSASRITREGAFSASATWSPDGSQLAFRSNRRGSIEIFRQSASGGGDPSFVLTGDVARSSGMSFVLALSDWSARGSVLLASQNPLSGFDLWMLPMDGSDQLKTYLNSGADQMHGNFSPDGSLVAYSSNESGRFEVYVQSNPLTDRKWSVSTSGGAEPRWRRDGKEIYYLAPDGTLMAVSVGPGPSFAVPRPLFRTQATGRVSFNRTRYVPSSDGQRFLITVPSTDEPTPITVVVNWAARLKQ